ncbi:MAG: XRE family transcriptional regulator, partial [Variovorax sp.]
MSTPLDIADRLEAARQASGLTRQALTEKAGVSRQAVYRLLKGQDVQVSTLLAVMDVLQLDLV